MTVAKPGNPHGQESDPLVQVSVKLDPETLKMLVTLEREHGQNIRGRRAAVLRRAIEHLFRSTRKQLTG